MILTSCAVLLLIMFMYSCRRSNERFSELIKRRKPCLDERCKRFDETRGVKFSEFAGWWVRFSILQALVEEVERQPSEELLNKIKKAFNDFVKGNKIKLTAEELAELQIIKEKI